MLVSGVNNNKHINWLSCRALNTPIILCVSSMFDAPLTGVNTDGNMTDQPRTANTSSPPRASSFPREGANASRRHQPHTSLPVCLQSTNQTAELQPEKLITGGTKYLCSNIVMWILKPKPFLPVHQHLCIKHLLCNKHSFYELVCFVEIKICHFSCYFTDTNVTVNLQKQ